jgi:hypothetical protein
MTLYLEVELLSSEVARRMAVNDTAVNDDCEPRDADI